MSSSDLPETLAGLLAEIESCSDFDERAEILIELAEGFSEVPESIATRPFPEDHRVPACESDAYVWLVANEGITRLYFAVENPQGISAKAMAAILSESLDGKPVSEACKVYPDIVTRIFGNSISMGKGQGLMSMVGMVRELARREVEQ